MISQLLKNVLVAIVSEFIDEITLKVLKLYYLTRN